MSQRQNGAGIIRQEKQCNALNDTDESELDVDHNGIELTAAPVQRIHPATGNRLAITMSRLLATAHGLVARPPSSMLPRHSSESLKVTLSEFAA
jgi:hypothetical protein